MKFIEIILYALMCLYTVYFANYCNKILERRIPRIFLLFVFPVVTAIVYFLLIKSHALIPIGYISLFLIYFIVLRFSFIGDIAAVYFATANVVFHLIIIRGMTMGVMSLILSENMFQIVENDFLYYISICISLVIMSITLYGFNLKIDVPKIKILINNQGQLKFLNAIQTLMLMFLLFCSHAYYYNLDLIWFSIFHLLVCVFLLLGFYFTLSMTTKTAIWIEDELNYEQVQEQLKKQVNRYKERENLFELIRQHNHDFKKVLKTMQQLLTNAEVDKAQEVLNEMQAEVSFTIQQNEKYSNVMIVDIILQELGDDCRNENINYTAECYLANTMLTDLQLCKIFNNLASNAIEACRKQPKEQKRWIELKSYVKENHTIIIARNSFDDVISFFGNELITTKKNNKGYHGLGIKSIKNIVNSIGGVSKIQVDKNEKKFSFLISLPNQ